MAINEISWNEEGEDNTSILESSALADFKDINSLAKAFIDTKAMVGNSIRVPSSEAGTEDIKAFHDNLMSKVPGLMYKPDADDSDGITNVLKSLGLPDDQAGYGEVKIDDTLLSEEDVASMKGFALEAGLTKRQFEVYANKVAAASKYQNEEMDIPCN